MRRVLASNPVQSVKPKNVSKQLTAQVRRDFINEFLQEEDGDSSYEIKQASNMSLEDGQGQSSSRDDGRQRDGLFRRMFRKRSRVSAASSDDPSQYKSTTALVDDTATVDEKVTEVRRKESGGAIHAATEEDDFEVTMRDGSTRTFHHYRTLFTPDLCKAYLEGTRNVIDHFLQFNDVTFATPTTTARIETTPSKPVYDRVFFVMTRSNPIRRFCRFIVGSDVVEARDEKEAMRVDLGTEHVEAEQVRRPLFDKIILLFIFASTIVLAIDTPLLRRESDFYANLFYGLDVFFFAIFTLEFLLRVLADGVLFTPKGYFKNIWNVLDFFVLFCMFMDSFIFYYRPNSQVRGGGRVGTFMPFLCLRVPLGCESLLPCCPRGASPPYHQPVHLPSGCLLHASSWLEGSFAWCCAPAVCAVWLFDLVRDALCWQDWLLQRPAVAQQGRVHWRVQRQCRRWRAPSVHGPARVGQAALL